jgi:hypothetical protein
MINRKLEMSMFEIKEELIMLMIFGEERVNMNLKDIEYDWKNKEFKFTFKEKKTDNMKHENVQIRDDLNIYHVMKILKYMSKNHLEFIVRYNHEMKEALNSLVSGALKEVKKA